MDPERVVIDTDRVIEEVRAWPQIWDSGHELYNNREARQKAWTAVTAAIVDKHDLSRLDRRKIEKKIQQRWRTSRDCYVKVRGQLLNSGKDSGSVHGNKIYGYYHALTFLEPTLRLPLKVQKRMAPAIGAQLVLPLAGAAAAADCCKRARPGNGAGPSEEPAAAELSPLERKLVSLVATRVGPLDEDDDNFFKSLAPLLRTFQPHQKLTFRSRVLALALEVQEWGLQQPVLEMAPSSLEEEEEDGDLLETKFRPPSAPPAALSAKDLADNEPPCTSS